MGAFDAGPTVHTGTDLDEYKQWLETQGIQGVGDVIFDDPDDARDVAEFTSLTGTDQTPG